MKKILYTLGNVVAVLLMFSPFVIIYYNSKISDSLYFWVLLISSISYCYFMYKKISE